MTTSRRASIAIALVLTGAACGGDDDEATPATEPDETQPDTEDACTETVAGTQVDFGVFTSATRIDPTLTSGGLVGGHELAAVYDVLFRFDFETNEYVPHLAESITPNEDHTVWTLKLREGITYADGTPLTAQLVADNMDRFFADETINASGGFLALIDEKTAIDELTLEMTLDAQWAELPFAFADEPGMIVNLNAIGDDPEAFAAQPPAEAGLGPYAVERNVPNEELVLKAREDYWGGPVCIERMRFVFIPGAQATYDAFANDELDVAFLREQSVRQEAMDDGYEGFFIQQDSGEVLLMNHADGRATADPRIREAVALALDSDVISDRVHRGNLLTGASLIQKGSRFHSEEIQAIDPDPERAASLVEEARSDGFDVHLRVLCASTGTHPDTALAVQGQLEAVGFDVTVEQMPQAEQIGQVVAGDYDTACWGLNLGPDTGPTALVRNLRSDSPGNRARYESDDMDAALDALLAADTQDDRERAAAAINDLYIDDSVAASFGAIEEGVVWQPEMKGVVPTAATIMLFHDAYLDADPE